AGKYDREGKVDIVWSSPLLSLKSNHPKATITFKKGESSTFQLEITPRGSSHVVRLQWNSSLHRNSSQGKFSTFWSRRKVGRVSRSVSDLRSHVGRHRP